MFTQWIPETPSLLAASAPGAVPDRVRTGLAIPWNTYGQTDRGRFRARRGSVPVPVAPRAVKLLAGHRHTGQPDPQPIGFLESAEDTPDGLVVRIRFAATPAGDAALLEADEGVRDALSVELTDIEFDGDELVASNMVALSLIPVPAFSTARLAAELVPPPPKEVPPMPEPTAPPFAPVPEAPAVSASMPPELSRPGPSGPQTVTELSAVMSTVNSGGMTPEVRAALADITYTANAWVQVPQYVGELWDGVAYEREIIPLLTTAPLTSMTVKGWKWATPPEVAPYAGDKAAVTSNAAVTEPTSVNAERLAGAHDIDRKFRDFNDTAFFESYYSAMAESYARQSDGAALADLKTAATAVTPVTGGSAWDQVLAVWAAVFGAPNSARPTFVLLGLNVAMALASVPATAAPASLALLGFSVDVLRPTPLIGADDILAGVKAGATFYELPGSPIRVEAVNLPNGGIDAGVFGYYATDVHAAQAFGKMTVPTTP